MNRWRQAAAVTMGLLASAGTAYAASNDLPQPVRTATVVGSAEEAAINTYVKTQITRVAAHDKTSSQAREDLCRQAESNQLIVPSAAFQSTYLRAVDGNLAPLLADKSDKGVPARLNAAIIVARLTNAAKLPQLQAKTEQLMADPAAAVSMWGIKSAGSMLPGFLNLPSLRDSQKITPAIVSAAKVHPQAGPLIQTAYDALYLSDQQPPLPATAFVPCVKAMNDLLSSRIQQYVTTVPESPQAERLPAVFFVRDVVRQAMAANPAQQTAAVQNMLDMLSLAAQHTSNLPPGEKGAQVVSLMTNYAGALNVLFKSLGQDAVAAKFQAVSTMRAPVQTAKAVQAVADGLAAVRALPAYKAVKDPPTVKP